MRRFLVDLGVPSDAIVSEGNSMNTLENIRNAGDGGQLPRGAGHIGLSHAAGVEDRAPGQPQCRRLSHRLAPAGRGATVMGELGAVDRRNGLVEHQLARAHCPEVGSSRRDLMASGSYRVRRRTTLRLAAGVAATGPQLLMFTRPPAACSDPRQGEHPDRLARPGRAWRLLPGDRHGALSQSPALIGVPTCARAGPASTSASC